MDLLKKEIKELIIDALNLEDMTPYDIDDNIQLFGDGLGLDSIDALELGIALKKKYGVQIEEGDSRARDYFRSVSSLAAFVHAQKTK
jgi:acyl carrier protein